MAAAGETSVPEEPSESVAEFRFELRTSKKAAPSAFDHDGAEASLDGIEMGEYSRKASVMLSRATMRSSPYYSEQLDGPWRDKKGVRLTLPSSQHMEAMQAVLASLEDADSVAITDETQLQVLSLAHRLKLWTLVERAEHFVAMRLGEDTIVGALALADRFGLRGLERVCYHWLKRSSDPRFAGAIADGIARELERRIDEASGGLATASAAALAGDFRWRPRLRAAGAEDTSSQVALEPAFDVDGISGRLQGRGGHRAGLEALVRLSRLEREAKRAFYLPVQVIELPPAVDPSAHGSRAGESGTAEPQKASSESTGRFVGDEEEGEEEEEDAAADGRVRMLTGPPGLDPLGAAVPTRSAPADGAKASGEAASASASPPAAAADSDDEDGEAGKPAAATAAAASAGQGGPGKSDDDAAAPVPAAASASAEGDADDDAAAGGPDGSSATAAAAAASSAGATAEDEAEPEAADLGGAAVDSALAADAEAELGYVCPEPLEPGVIQAEDVARYRQLKERRAAGRLPRFYRVRKPKRAGYEGMVRCYVRRVRDGYGACRHGEADVEWRRVVRELMGEDEASAREEAAARRRRPQGAEAVVAAAKSTDGVPMCGRRVRHYYELRRERDHSLIMAAACFDESGSFVFTRRADDVRPHGRHYLGAVRGDRLGTRFIVHDFGLAADAGEGPARRLAEVVPSMAQRAVAEVHFDTNIMGAVPNSCSVVLHPTPANAQAEDLLPKSLNRARQRTVANQAALANAGFLASATRFVSSVFEGGAAMLFSVDGDASPVRMPDDPRSVSRGVCIGVGRASSDAADAHSDALAAHVEASTGVRPAFSPPRVVRLVSRQPDWNEDMEAWTMDFRSRATLASKKNFQLVPEGQRDDAEPTVLFLMGKRGKDLYSVDFAAPLSPAAAFGIALTTFAQKWAVA